MQISSRCSRTLGHEVRTVESDVVDAHVDGPEVGESLEVDGLRKTGKARARVRSGQNKDVWRLDSLRSFARWPSCCRGRRVKGEESAGWSPSSSRVSSCGLGMASA